MLLIDLVAVSGRVAATRSRRAKIALMAEALEAMSADELALGVAYLHGVLPQGKIGAGPALVREASERAVSRHASANLTLTQVDRAFSDLAAIAGPGSASRRSQALFALFSAASEQEQAFLIGVVLGDLRQGALEGILLDAMAIAWQSPVAAVQRAVMLAGDPATVAAAVARDGTAALASFRLRLMRPVRPMLAQTAVDTRVALDALGEAGFEYKLDGARVQVHKHDGSVRAYTRQLNEVSDRLPEVVEQVAALPARSLILDGEVLALRADGRAQPFQVTMRRFGRRLNVASMRAELPLSVSFFDCLYAEGEELLDLPWSARAEHLAELLPEALRVPCKVTDNPVEAEEFLHQAMQAGHEGIMAKALGSPYEAGSRGAAWLKIKPTHSADLVVLAAEWGSGRRSGWLSNLHLGASK